MIGKSCFGTPIRTSRIRTTSDGAEIAAGRNPVVKKAGVIDDSFVALAKKATANATTSKEAFTITDQFSRDLFQKYAELRQLGASGDKAEQKLLISELLSNSKYLVAPKTYDNKELILQMDGSKAALEQYGNRIAAILKNNKIEGRNEAIIVKESLAKEDPSILKELDPIIASYKTMLQEFIATPAPQPLFQYHKKLVNAFSLLVYINESYRKADTDPVVALQGLSRVQDGIVMLFDSLKGIKTYLEAAGLAFNPQ
jgi:hypothetical protein